MSTVRSNAGAPSMIAGLLAWVVGLFLATRCEIDEVIGVAVLAAGFVLLWVGSFLINALRLSTLGNAAVTTLIFGLLGTGMGFAYVLISFSSCFTF